MEGEKSPKDLMQYVNLGRSGLLVSRLGYGNWVTGNDADRCTNRQGLHAGSRARRIPGGFHSLAKTLSTSHTSASGSRQSIVRHRFYRGLKAATDR